MPDLNEAIQFDPLSDTFFNDPTDLYRQLRDEAPLFYDPKLDMWVVSRYDDVAAALRDWETFSSAKGVTLSQVLEPEFDGTFVMMTMDPPEHQRLRSLVSKVFTPRAIAGVEPMLRDLVRSYLAPLETVDHFDAFTDFAAPFPVNAICSILGVPIDIRENLRHWVDAMLHREPGDPRMTQAGLHASIEIAMYFFNLAAERRANPGSDLISSLCTATITDDHGQPMQLDDRDVAGFSILLAGAGTETVAKLMGSMFVTLHRNPSVRSAVLADPSLSAALVEEGMRYHPPAQYMCRFTTRTAALPSGEIPGNSRVMLLMGAAMRDPRAFDDPDEFQLNRPKKIALGFGYGIHACLGAALARLEARIAFEEFLARWPDYQVEEEGLVRVTQENTAGYCSVPVAVKPLR